MLEDIRILLVGIFVLLFIITLAVLSKSADDSTRARSARIYERVKSIVGWSLVGLAGLLVAAVIYTGFTG